MRDEPRRHRGWLTLLAIASAATAPYAFVGRPTWTLWGLPAWLWSSLSASLALSGLIAWGVWRYWRDDDA